MRPAEPERGLDRSGVEAADLVVAAHAAVDVDAVHDVVDDACELRGGLGVRLQQHRGVTRLARLRRGLERGDRSGAVRVRSEVAVQVHRPGDVDAHGARLARPRAYAPALGIDGPTDRRRRPRVRHGPEPSVARRAELAAADGFAHVDVLLEADDGALALPVGCPIAFPKPQPVWCSTPAPPAGPDAWDRTVRWWTAAPDALCEPWAGASVRSIDDVRALADAVPGVRFLIDTGHVTAWGGDILELLPYAGHVQVRDARPVRPRSHRGRATWTSPRCSAGWPTSGTRARSRSSTSTCPSTAGRARIRAPPRWRYGTSSSPSAEPGRRRWAVRGRPPETFRSAARLRLRRGACGSRRTATPQ